jgi:hypothetical protein
LNHTLALLLILLSFLTTHFQSSQTSGDISQVPTTNTLCVFDPAGLPIPIQFGDSVMLTQVIKRSGIPRESIKNEVWIIRRLETKLIQQTTVDLKVIEKGKIADQRLDQHDIVFVVGKKNRPWANLEASYRGCAICSCKVISGMHGPLIVPKEWNEADVADEKNPGPNNQKP